MISRIPFFACLMLVVSSAIAQETPQPIINASPEQKLLVEKTPTGGLPPAVGVQNIQIFRATRVPEFWADGKGWTYNHHMDLAVWKGHYLIAFTNGKVDEDVPPDHQLFLHSTDGIHWTKPQELFPLGESGSTRMYFFHASNGRMIALAALRTTDFFARNLERLAPGPISAPRPLIDPTSRQGIIAREVLPDCTLGSTFILQKPTNKEPVSKAPGFETLTDKELQAACREVLDNHTFLEQQDHGRMLGPDRMAIYEGMDDNFGQAFCFYYRKDGTLIATGKNGWVITSTDNGKTFAKPVIPDGFITNNAKVWVQKTSDNLFAMIYNPTLRDRFPLVVATSDDGITFKNMRVLHGEVPQQRYPGLFKNPGAQYIRGVSMFDNDGSKEMLVPLNDGVNRLPERDMLIVYSSNKEDIWVSRIPVPIQPDETKPVSDHFNRPAASGFLVNDWNIYSPLWAQVSVIPVSTVDVPGASAGAKAMQLEDRDPYDYARASRVFPQAAKVSVQFTLSASTLAANSENPLEIELEPALGTARPIRLAITPDKKLVTRSGQRKIELAAITPGESYVIALSADCLDTPAGKPDSTYQPNGDPSYGTWSITVNGKTTPNLAFAEPAPALARLTIRTGPYRGVGTPTSNGQPTAPTPVDPATDKPVAANTFLIRDVEIK